MEIRLFRPTDLEALKAIHDAFYPDQPFRMGRHTWVIEEGDDVIGYTAVSPVPGLDGLFTLIGGIAPTQQRRGWGRQLLTHTLREARKRGVRQLSHPVTDLNSPAARFLRHHGFALEHEEWLMTLPDLTRLDTAVPPASCRIQTHPTLAAVRRQFRTLYDQSFGDKPWYQPYSADEVAETLDNPADILFLFKNNRPIGFAWLQGEMIEPIGIVTGEQGRGYGRFLLLAALHKLQQRGASQARIGVWRDNHAAVYLYQSLGFRRRQTLTYLAFTVQ